MTTIVKQASLIAAVILSTVAARAAECPSPLPAEMSKDQLSACLLEISNLRRDVQKLQSQLNDVAAKQIKLGSVYEVQTNPTTGVGSCGDGSVMVGVAIIGTNGSGTKIKCANFSR
jgi:hypothetical protein